ncbi:sulfite reductase subunit alpha [Pelagicoccus sp. SDUM812005]|uniref:sulfite reductase subunit alpha n=1 Tax=Pelagicoccus sp. SDUM812005 TaxID=3041257 RepID=UPI00280CC89A|nr:sulfite reductase subunit alpha [Pelagicoccus sp. SDUM812005]MDQ8183265.1 sulfite reductase subunit alpha [Pelagicoccus sp. SDUM812005]
MSSPFIPDTAPFSVEQRAWLNGFLAGMFSSQDGGQSTVVMEAKPVSILWGSQTGNSEGLARKISKALGNKGFAPTVYDMDDYDVAKLAEESMLLLVTSTFGDGEPPDNAAAFYNWLLSDEAPQLPNLKYSVLALGDSNYPEFCKCGIDIDLRFKALGATPIVERVDCDADYDDAFEAWLKSVEDAAGAAASAEGSEEAAPTEPEFGKKNPFPAKLLANYNLNAETSSKETRHVELSLEGSGMSYEPGDALAVMPVNDAGYVEDLLQATGFTGEEAVEGSTLRQLLTETYDITNLTLKTLKAYADLSGSEKLAELAEDKDAFKAYSWGRQFIDLLIEAPVRFGKPEELLALLGKLAPRLYSISSSPRAHENEVHVTVGVVRYDSHGRARKGVCSNFLADHGGEDPVRIYFHHTKTFKLPTDANAPVIMVGPGTGIAPFRAFLEERAATKAAGKNWLFFGDQHAASDFLYQEQLSEYQASGVLTQLDTAFSRDQEQKVYVQDRMREKGAELYEWLEAGGHFYVCGDASRMAKDVDAALHQVIAEHGNKTEEEAAAYVEAMKKSKRYLRDVY